jgi:hypothetical protein
LLNYYCSRPDLATADQVSGANLAHVAPAQLAVYGEVEQRAVAEPALVVQPEQNGPCLLGLLRVFGPYQTTSISSASVLSGRIVFKVSHGLAPSAGRHWPRRAIMRRVVIQNRKRDAAKADWQLSSAW